jgi:hypothetical protein
MGMFCDGNIGLESATNLHGMHIALLVLMKINNTITEIGGNPKW